MMDIYVKEEAPRRVASQLKKLQEESQKKSPAGPPGETAVRPASAEPAPEAPAHKEVVVEAVQPTPSPRAEPTAAPTAAPTAVAETVVAPSEKLGEAETPSKILRVVKPTYPQL